MTNPARERFFGLVAAAITEMTGKIYDCAVDGTAVTISINLYHHKYDCIDPESVAAAEKKAISAFAHKIIDNLSDKTERFSLSVNSLTLDPSTYYPIIEIAIKQA